MTLSFFKNTFAGNPLNRASEIRPDAALMEEKLHAEGSLAVAIWNGQPLVEDAPDGSPRLAYIAAALAAQQSVGWEQLLFLGFWNETAVFAVDLDGPANPVDGPLAGLGRFGDLRTLSAQMPAEDGAIAATAKQMFEWRRKHRHCSNCGQPSHAADGGWKRLCASCKTEHFPRTDPVVIMLAVKDGRCLLGRSPRFPKGMFSALAGFLEPGESIEEACARELMEEARLKTASVTYHSTQPWPYPSSLMIGLIAQVENDDAVADDTELDEIRWFTKIEAKALIQGSLAGYFCPPATAIAHQLIKSWAEA
jgi:NAD+ diphosphatase